MNLISDIRLGFRCEYLLEQTAEYKRRSVNDDTYYLAYLSQFKRYREMKEQITYDPIKKILGELEKKLLEGATKDE